MKRLLAIGVAAVAAMLVFAAPSFAAPEGPQVCTPEVQESVGLESTGQCVSIYQELAYFGERYESENFPGGTGAVAECKYFDGLLKLQGYGGLQGIGATFGECVEFYKYLEEKQLVP